MSFAVLNKHTKSALEQEHVTVRRSLSVFTFTFVSELVTRFTKQLFCNLNGLNWTSSVQQLLTKTYTDDAMSN